MRRATIWMAATLFACGADEGVTPTPTSGPGADDEATPTALFGADDEIQTVAGGPISGRWCGAYRVLGDVEVPDGEILELCAGTVVELTSGVTVTVTGTLRALGEEDAPVVLSALDGWDGLSVKGELEGGWLRIERATLCIDGGEASQIRFTHSRLEGCRVGNRLRNGASFVSSEILGGSTLYLEGGMLHMVDSTVDLGHPSASPDCTSVSGGGMNLDHVRFTGCHCPLHINSASASVTASGSIFDGAAVAMMIARTEGATFSGNHLLGGSWDIQDIGGGSGAIQAHIAGNYYGGEAPDLSTSDPSQFTGADVWEASPIEGVGPR